MAVILNRFAAPRCVFSFFFGFDRLRGMTRNSLLFLFFPYSVIPTGVARFFPACGFCTPGTERRDLGLLSNSPMPL